MLPPGHPLADVPIPQIKGRPIDLKQYRGKALIVAIIATTCKDCGDTIDILSRIQQQNAGKGLRVVAAAGDDNAPRVVPAFTLQHNPPFPVGYLDRAGIIKLANLDPNAHPFVPILMFVDAKGAVRVQLFGDDPLMKNPELIIKGTVKELLKEPGIVPGK
jgi:thiol-disulfide isomerase/thioredoxin